MPQPIKRLPDWQRRLANTLATAHQVPFEWGKWDCAMAACRLIHAQTGIDIGEQFRGTYASEADAIALIGAKLVNFPAGTTEEEIQQLKAQNLGNFAAEIAQSFAFEEVEPNYARRGDLVLVNNGVPGGALGVVGLDGRYAHCAADSGMKRIAIHRWLRAWRVS